MEVEEEGWVERIGKEERGIAKLGDKGKEEREGDGETEKREMRRKRKIYT